MEPRRVFLVVLVVCDKKIFFPLCCLWWLWRPLSRMLAAALDQGNLTGFSMGSRDSEALVVNHLLFPDDTLIFCGAQEEQIRHLRCIFLCFEATSGLRIN
jgi:hypothetical protein